MYLTYLVGYGGCVHWGTSPFFWGDMEPASDYEPKTLSQAPGSMPVLGTLEGTRVMTDLYCNRLEYKCQVI